MRGLQILWIDILQGDDEASQLKAAFQVLLEQSVLMVSRKGAGKTLFQITGWSHTSDLNRDPSNSFQVTWNLPSTEGCEAFPSQAAGTGGPEASVPRGWSNVQG